MGFNSAFKGLNIKKTGTNDIHVDVLTVLLSQRCISSATYQMCYILPNLVFFLPHFIIYLFSTTLSRFQSSLLNFSYMYWIDEPC